MANPGGGKMDEGAELATAGLVVAFAAVLLVASHFFVEALNQPSASSIALYLLEQEPILSLLGYELAAV